MANLIPPRRGEELTPDGRATVRFSRYLERVSDDVNEATQSVENITTSETFETSAGSAQFQEYADEAAQALDFVPVSSKKDWAGTVASANYTAVDRDFVEGRSGAVIKLSKNNQEGAQIEVGNGDGSIITVDGDGVELRYAGKRAFKIELLREGTFIHWYLFQYANELYWRGG